MPNKREKTTMDYEIARRMPLFTRENRDKIRLGVKTQTTIL